MSFKLTDKQNEAILSVISWYFMTSYKKLLFTLAGVAGSGKSTVIKYAIESLGLLRDDVLFVALTGKAVSVLRTKGHLANTIHKTFYSARKINGKVYFSLKKSIPRNIQLIVVDEFAMIDDAMANDILSFGIPTLATCDPGQLPPIFGKNTYLDEDKLDIFLTEVMRTDDTTGITDMAMVVRNGNLLKPGRYKASRVLDNKDDIKPLVEYDVILVWRNKTRRYLNQVIRKELGLIDRYPKKGERVYFLSNRYDVSIMYQGIELNLVNGLQCDVMSDYSIIDDKTISLTVKPSFIPEDNYTFDVPCSREVFDSYYENSIPVSKMIENSTIDEDGLFFCDFAYSMSVHSSQGDSANNVLLIDEMPKYRPEYYQWLYTGITRGIFSVDILLDQ